MSHDLVKMVLQSFINVFVRKSVEKLTYSGSKKTLPRSISQAKQRHPKLLSRESSKRSGRRLALRRICTLLHDNWNSMLNKLK